MTVVNFIVLVEAQKWRYWSKILHVKFCWPYLQVILLPSFPISISKKVKFFCLSLPVHFEEVPALCKQSMSDRRSKDRRSKDRRSRLPIFFFAIGSRSVIVIMPKDRVAIGDRKLNDQDRKKRDVFSDLFRYLLDIHFGIDFTRIFQVTLNFFTISKKAGKKVLNLFLLAVLTEGTYYSRGRNISVFCRDKTRLYAFCEVILVIHFNWHDALFGKQLKMNKCHWSCNFFDWIFHSDCYIIS